MQPFSRGSVYLNYLGNEETDRIKSAYGEVTYDRLTRIKAKYDPHNLFRVNQNITPT
jgi:FAD/FMN-containing dehydrogenase